MRSHKAGSQRNKCAAAIPMLIAKSDWCNGAWRILTGCPRSIQDPALSGLEKSKGTNDQKEYIQGRTGHSVSEGIGILTQIWLWTTSIIKWFMHWNVHCGILKW